MSPNSWSLEDNWKYCVVSMRLKIMEIIEFHLIYLTKSSLNPIYIALVKQEVLQHILGEMMHSSIPFSHGQ